MKSWRVEKPSRKLETPAEPASYIKPCNHRHYRRQLQELQQPTEDVAENQLQEEVVESQEEEVEEDEEPP